MKKRVDMQLNLLLHEWDHQNLIIIHENEEINKIRFFTKGLLPDPTTLYLISEEDYIDNELKGSFVLYTDKDLSEIENNKNNNIVIVNSPSDPKKDFNDLLSIYDHYQGFYDQILNLVSQNASIEEFILEIHRFFDAKLCILDNSKKLIYNIFDFKSVGKIFPLEIHKKSMMRIYGYFGFEELDPIYDHELNKIIKIIEYYFYNKTIALMNSKDHFYQSLKNLSQDAFREEDYQNLRNITWELEDEYELFIIALENGLFFYKNMFINGNRFSLDHPMYMYSIIDNNKLICLINHKGKKQDKLISDLEEFIDEYELKSARIPLYNDLFQYSKSLTMGHMLVDHNITLEGPLDQHLTSLVYELALRFSNLESFLPKELRILKEHDDKNNSDLLKTLYFYLLEERSLIKASEKLDVHRNSIVYRTNKINEIVDIDLDNTAIRINILSALEIMYRCGMIRT